MHEDTGNFTIHDTQSSRVLGAGTQKQTDYSATSKTAVVGGTFLGSSAADRRLENAIEIGAEWIIGIIFIFGFFSGVMR